MQPIFIMFIYIYPKLRKVEEFASSVIFDIKLYFSFVSQRASTTISYNVRITIRSSTHQKDCRNFIMYELSDALVYNIYIYICVAQDYIEKELQPSAKRVMRG